jgi:phage shock protein A
MKERIASRVGRIISGSFNQLIDAFENAAPETIMEQAIREVDGAIDDIRIELGRIAANKHLASQRLTGANNHHAELSSKIELAIKEEREDLAEAAVAKQLDLEAQAPVLESTIKEAGKKEKELEGYIAALQAKKREMNEELLQFHRTRISSESGAYAPDQNHTAGIEVQSRVSRAESAFDRVLEKQTGLPGSPMDVKTSSQLMELEDISRKKRIKERLTATKAKIVKD